MYPAARRLAIRLLIVSGALLPAAPPAVAQAAAGDGFKGRGAAMCVAAGEFLAEKPGADPGIPGGVAAWRQVLQVMDGTEERRQAALDSARAGLASLGEAQVAGEAFAARELWSAACSSRAFQVDYMVAHGSPERLRANLAEERGTALGPEAVQRLNVSISCIVAAEVLSRPRPSRALRAAIRVANPAIPDVGALNAIRARSHQDVRAAPGSAIGKELAVDYIRHIYDVASSGNDPQPFVDFMGLLLRDHCPAGAGS